jgi:hypothetical protein
MNCFDLAAIGLHLASVHGRDGYNDMNPGLYVQTECGIVVGGFYNSYRKPSVQIGWRGEPEHLPVFIEAGVVTGYPGHDVAVYAMGGLRLGPVRIGVVPHVPGLNRTTMVHAMVQFRL